MQKNIQNKKLDAQETKQEEVLRDFFFPATGTTIRATSREEAEFLYNKDNK